MAKFKIIFKGGDYVVLKLSKDVTVQSLINEGFIIQRDGNLYTKDNKRVIIIERDFFRNNPALIGECGGSVYEIYNNEVMTNWHVAKCANRLDFYSATYELMKNSINYIEYRPNIFPGFVWEILQFFGISIDSIYDFAIIPFNGGNIYFNIDSPRPRAVYTAGTCMDKSERGCLGIALPSPIEDSPEYITALKNRKLIIDCTYWNYKTEGFGLDVGETFINYGNGYAKFKYALLIAFPSTPAIPGCSGSIVYPITP